MEIKIWCLSTDNFVVYINKAGAEDGGYHFTGEQLSTAFAREFQEELLEAFRMSASAGSTATMTWAEAHSRSALKSA